MKFIRLIQDAKKQKLSKIEVAVLLNAHYKLDIDLAISLAKEGLIPQLLAKELSKRYTWPGYDCTKTKASGLNFSTPIDTSNRNYVIYHNNSSDRRVEYQTKEEFAKALRVECGVPDEYNLVWTKTGYPKVLYAETIEELTYIIYREIDRSIGYCKRMLEFEIEGVNSELLQHWNTMHQCIMLNKMFTVKKKCYIGYCDNAVSLHGYDDITKTIITWVTPNTYHVTGDNDNEISINRPYQWSSIPDWHPNMIDKMDTTDYLILSNLTVRQLDKLYGSRTVLGLFDNMNLECEDDHIWNLRDRVFKNVSVDALELLLNSVTREKAIEFTGNILQLTYHRLKSIIPKDTGK